MRKILLSLLVVATSGALLPGPARAAGPCAPPNAPDPMPEGAAHDHTEVAQHAFSCRLDLVAYRGLTDLVPEPMWFGELDVAGDVAVQATAFPEAGLVTFDVSDPRDPKPLARWFGPRCEEPLRDSDCGADVKLNRDGTVAFLATQAVARVPMPSTNPLSYAAPTEPGILVIDLADPSFPILDSYLPVEPAGVHMLAYHEIGGTGYVFAMHNLVGLLVARVDHVGPQTVLVPVSTPTVEAGGHDVFPYTDPVDGRTYLYVSGEYNGLEIYDATDPANLVRVGGWNPGSQWYTHSAWTFRWGARRYTFVVPELFSGTARSVGPLWLLDTTDHGAPALVGQWTNPGNHRGGQLGFSPHNLSYADGFVSIAHYHGGVWRLDWRPVLDGITTRPIEDGYHVPHAGVRPLITTLRRPPLQFITGFELNRRPSVWDVAIDGGYTYASDMTSGFYVLEPSA